MKMNIFPNGAPVELLYGIAAISGGVARYLNSFASGTPFNIGVFLASTFVSGFSGYMFAIIGLAMNMPSPVLFAMAGAGGFFGDQTMKLVMEWLTKTVK